MNGFDLSEGFFEAIRQYKILTENTVECIWLLDLGNHRFKYISPSVTQLRGLTVAEAMKEAFEDSLTPESLEQINAKRDIRIPKFLAGDRSAEVISGVDEYEQYCKDGSIKTIEASTKLIYNPDTKYVDILGVSRDISERKTFEKTLLLQLQEKEHQLAEYTQEIKNRIEISKGKISCFGKFTIHNNKSECPIKWRTAKTEELFAFMLQYNGSKIPKYEICENLWPGCDGDKVDTLLHTTLYKMKKVLDSIGIKYDIKFQNGSYWMLLPEVSLDTAEFDSLVTPDIPLNKKNASFAERAFSLYTGDYLQSHDYLWAIPKAEEYSRKYINLATTLVRYHLESNDYDSAVKILKEVVRINPACELAHKTLLRLYFVNNNRIEFLTHYNMLATTLMAEYGIEPSRAIQSMHRSLLDL